MTAVQPPVLLVEGKTDEYLIVQLLMQHGIFAHGAHGKSLSAASRAKVEVVVEYLSTDSGGSGSKSELLDDVVARIRRPAHRAIGYVFDADDPTHTEWSRSKTWQSVRQQIDHSAALAATPEAISPDGYRGTHTGTGTRIGAWLMPDNIRDGSLEDFLRDLMSADDRLILHAEASSRTAKDDHGATFPEKDFKKAVIETWLAWQEEPGMTYGTAFQKRQLLSDADLAQRFVNWVKWLIEPNVSTPTS